MDALIGRFADGVGLGRVIFKDAVSQQTPIPIRKKLFARDNRKAYYVIGSLTFQVHDAGIAIVQVDV